LSGAVTTQLDQHLFMPYDHCILQHHPNCGCLADFISDPGLKNCWHGRGLNTQP